MAIFRQLSNSLALLATLAMISACASPSAVSPSPRVQAPSSPAQVEEGESLEVAEESVNPFDRLIAQRRRSEQPQFEVDDYGFSIEERVRISGDAFARYEQAQSLLRQERFAEAVEALAALIERDPELTAPYIDLGIAYRRMDRLEPAAAALESAVRLSPEHPIAHNELGITYRLLGQFEAARIEYETALAAFEEFHYARRNLAVLCDLYLADLECAVANYRRYLDSVGEDAEVEIWIADLMARASLVAAGAEQ